MSSILKGFLSHRLRAAVLAFLLSIFSCGTCLLFSVASFASAERKSVYSSFNTIAAPNLNSNNYSTDEEISSRRAHVAAAAAFAQTVEFASLSEHTLVLGYCEDLNPAFDKEMHAPSAPYMPAYNATYPNDIGLYDGVCIEHSFRLVPTQEAETGRIRISGIYKTIISPKKSLYKSCFQLTDTIPSEIYLSTETDVRKGAHYMFFGAFGKIEGYTFFSLGSSLGDMFPDYPGYPYIIELPDGLTAEEYIETDEVKEKLGGMVEMFEKNVHSVPVVLTDSLMSIYNFNSGKTPVKQGRAFTDEEYVSGAQVCVISSALAKANGLKVGDTLDMQFYNRGRLNSDKVGLITDTELYAPYFSGITPITESMKYEIVGIYESSGRFLFGEHDFTPNTIFIPSASMTDGAVRENLNADWEPVPTKLTSIVIENGKLDEFQEEMKSLGFENCFIYCDENGMTQTLAEASQNEDRIMPVFAASAAAFTAAAILFAAVAGASIKRSDEYKALLAKSRAKAYISSLLSMLVFGFCALTAGAVISYFLFDTVAAMLTGANSGIDFSPITALEALGLETIVTAAAAAAACIDKKGRHIS